MERFLYRLAQTSHREALLLKGALLLRAWGIPSARPTADIDMTSPRDVSILDLLSIFRESMNVDFNDGLTFHSDSIRTEPIEKGTDFQGTRFLFRMKDYFDICVLARNLDFHGAVLQDAILAVFEKRQIPIPKSVPPGLAEEFAEDAMKRVQWNAFIKRLVDLEKPPALDEAICVIRAFIMPPLMAFHEGRRFDFVWPAGGPWRAQEQEHIG